MVEFIDKTAEASGTPLNRFYMMSVQGFEDLTVTFNNDGTVTEKNSLGEIKTTKFNQNGSISEVFDGEKTITKTTTFKDNGEIVQAIEWGA